MSQRVHFLFRRTKLYCLVLFLLSGCTIFFGETRSLVTTIQAAAPSPFSLQANLTRSTRYIEVVGLEAHSEKGTRLRITITSRGREAFLAKLTDGQFVQVEPNEPIDVFDDRVEKTTLLRLPVMGIEHRTPCDIRLEMVGLPRFHDAVKIYLFKSSAPM